MARHHILWMVEVCSLLLCPGELGDLRELSPPAGPLANFEEFFDFSGTIDDNDSLSKAETPELVSLSLTNPGLESNCEPDAIHHMLTLSLMMEELLDLLWLGPWKEIDGGEAAYYQTSEWKWDSPMPSQVPPHTQYQDMSHSVHAWSTKKLRVP